MNRQVASFKQAFGSAFYLSVYLALSCLPAQAQNLSNVIASPGYSGLALTPLATPLPWGTLAATYDTSNAGAQYVVGHNYLFSAGIVPGLEITGRLATNNHQCNLYGIGSVCPAGSYRDLSASAKVGGQFEIFHKTWLSGSVGMTEFGGAATNFRSYYTVAGMKQTSWSGTLGYAQAVSTAAPLKGVFGHLVWQVAKPFQVYTERIGRGSWVGARIEQPWGKGGQNRFYVSANKALQANGLTAKQWWSVGIRIPFETPGNGAQYVGQDEFKVLPSTEVIQKNSPSHEIVSASLESLPSNVVKESANKLASALAKVGFESISVGEDKFGPLVQLENYSYNWNQLDALGVAMGVLSQHAMNWPATRLQLLRYGVPVYLAVAKPACMYSWLEQNGFDCGAPTNLELWAGQHAHIEASASTVWWVKNERSSAGRTKMLVTPAIDSRVGTEYGTFDSTWGLNLTWQTPLWQGATADLAYVKSLGHSNDYSLGGVYSDFRIDSLLHRAMLHQALALPWGFSAKVAYGRLVQVLEGHHGELRWESASGRHRISYEASHFAHREVNFSKDFKMATYRLAMPQWGNSLELKSGVFWHGDKGHMLISRHWFGDTSLSLFLRRSQFAPGVSVLFSPYGSVPVKSAGIEISFPLTPRRETHSEWLQPRGDDRFSYGVQSVVRAKNSTNYVSPYFGIFSPVPLGLDGGIYNYDRGSQDYLMNNLARVRQAWRTLGPLN